MLKKLTYTENLFKKICFSEKNVFNLVFQFFRKKMNNKELTSELAKRLEKSQKDVTQLLEATVLTMKEEFVKGNSISFQGFGVFEIKKKEERIAVNPATQKRMLVPPKLVLNFKPSSILKEKLKDISQ